MICKSGQHTYDGPTRYGCPTCHAESNRQWKVTNRDLVNKRARIARGERYKKDPAMRDRHIKQAAQWRKDNPEKSKALRRDNEAKRRVAKVTNGPVEDIKATDIWTRDGGVCYLCDSPVTLSLAHLDHVIPVSRGGTHTPDNVRVTHARCNLRKGARPLKGV